MQNKPVIQRINVICQNYMAARKQEYRLSVQRRGNFKKRQSIPQKELNGIELQATIMTI
jgi:hypothetical protein